MIRAIVAVSGIVCGILVVSFLGWTSLFWPDWTAGLLRKIERWTEDEELWEVVGNHINHIRHWLWYELFLDIEFARTFYVLAGINFLFCFARKYL